MESVRIWLESETPRWIEILGALGPPITGIIVVGISVLVYLLQRRQHLVEKERFKRELYTRRREILENLRTAIEFVVTGGTDADRFHELDTKIANDWFDIQYLFDADVLDFYQEVRMPIISCWDANRQIEAFGEDVQADSDAAQERRSIINSRIGLRESLMEWRMRMVPLFRRYLRLDPYFL